MANTLNENTKEAKLSEQPQDIGGELFNDLFRITNEISANGRSNDDQEQYLTQQMQRAAQAGKLYDMNWKPVENANSSMLDDGDLFFTYAPGDVRLLKKDSISMQPLSVKEFTKTAMPDSRPKLDPPLTAGEKIGNFFMRLFTFGVRGIARVEAHERAVAEWEKDKLALADKAGYPVRTENEQTEPESNVIEIGTEKEKLQKIVRKSPQEKADELFDNMEKMGYVSRWGSIMKSALKDKNYSKLLDKLSVLDPTDQKIILENSLDEKRTTFDKTDMDALANQIAAFEEDPEAYRANYEKETGKVIPSNEERKLVNDLKERIDRVVETDPSHLWKGAGFVTAMLHRAAYGENRDMDAVRGLNDLTNPQIVAMCENVMVALGKREKGVVYDPFALADFVAEVKNMKPQVSAGSSKGGKQPGPVKQNLNN